MVLAPIDLTNAKAWRNEWRELLIRIRNCPLLSRNGGGSAGSQTEVFASAPYNGDTVLSNYPSPRGRPKTRPYEL
jgi:hypothetical protein